MKEGQIYIYIYNEEAIEHEIHDEPGVIFSIRKGIYIKQQNISDWNIALVMDIYHGAKGYFE